MLNIANNKLLFIENRQKTIFWEKLTLDFIRIKTQEYDTLKQEIESLKQEAKNMDKNLL